MEGRRFVLGIDGKWLRRKGVVLIYRDVTNGENLFWSWWSSESYQALHTDLEKLTGLLGDNFPSGAISDWQGSMVSGVSLFLDIPHQRCLVHVVRTAKKLLPKRSPLPATVGLRKIAIQLTDIKNQKQKTIWLSQLIKWEKEYLHLLKERTFNQNNYSDKRNWWYTHRNLRRAWALLTNDWKPFFIHLDHPLIPSSNNSLEGTNGQAKGKLLSHRGMKADQQVSFFFWYLTFTRAKTKLQLKHLWGRWKSQI